MLRRLLTIALLLTLGCSPTEPVPPPPPSPETLKLFADATEAMKADKPREAIELFTKYIAEDPYNAPAHANRAACYGAIGEYEHMVAGAHTALVIDKTNVSSLEMLAAYYHKGQDHKDARHFAKLLLEVDPGNKVGSKVLAATREFAPQ